MTKLPLLLSTSLVVLLAACATNVEPPTTEHPLDFQVAEQTEISCQSDTDCELPFDWAARSVCPYEARCLEERCAIVCPAPFFHPSHNADVTDFESCAAAGNPVMESYPRQCRDGGQTFVEDITLSENEVCPISEIEALATARQLAEEKNWGKPQRSEIREDGFWFFFDTSESVAEKIIVIDCQTGESRFILEN